MQVLAVANARRQLYHSADAAKSGSTTAKGALGLRQEWTSGFFKPET